MMTDRKKISVLLVHNRYQERGGEDAVFEAETRLLESHGHPAACLEFDNADIPDQRSPLLSARLAVSTIWSASAASRVLDAVSRFQPDLVHFHNTFPQVSPSAYAACRKAGVPVVQTVHNYRLICPNADFFRQGRICEDCLGKTLPWPGVWHGCYRGSRGQTTVVAAMLAVHRLRHTWDSNVDSYIALTSFAREKLIEGGLPPDKIVVKPNFLDQYAPVGAHDGDFVLFVGRLVTNKGVETLLQAWTSPDDLPPLRIVGDGPLAQVVEAAAGSNPNIHYLGRRPRESVLKSMGQAQALIFPSRWYEGFPMTIVESLACGLPVIASRLGAMGEIVEDNRTGLHFEPGNPADLAAKVKWAWTQKEEMRRMGLEARREYESKYTADQNYDQLIKIYERALATTKKRSS